MDRAALLPPVRWGDPVTAEPDGEFLLPVGTVTMLLADVESSSRLWEESETDMSDAMRRLDELVTDSIGRHHGVRPLEQGEGDSFVAAFARASEAVACALDISRAAPLRLRIGVHTGEAQRTDAGTYVGPAVNRTARLRDAAHGGQVVLTLAAVEVVGDKLPDGCSVTDLGVHRLRDLSRPERIFQLAHADLLRKDFPPLRTLDTYRHNLPTQRTSFVGRQREMDDVRALLDESSLVTLTGAGGCGKTRLALQVAASLLDSNPDGVFLADLSTASAETVAPTVARELGVGDEPRDVLEPYLRNKTLLLVLDMCEHVVDACAVLCDRLLAGAPGLRVLATSREALGISGETAYRVPSLDVPPADVSDIAGLAQHAATELFVDRARRARATFAPTDASAIGEICRRLGGIPLAIELAAARVTVFSPRQIVERLDDHFRLLTGGVRTAMPRQQTLRASVDWSHDLLTEPERIVFRRLAVFAGGFTMDAAETVCAGDGVEGHQVLDLVTLLVGKSLVQADQEAERYTLLETIRQYAVERLRAADEEDLTRTRHGDHYLWQAERLDADASLDKAVEAVAATVNEAANICGSFDWSLEQDDVDSMARWVVAIGRSGRPPFGWFDEWASTLATRLGRLAPPLRARAVCVLANPMLRLGLVSSSLVEEALEHLRSESDSEWLARALRAHARASGDEEAVAVLWEAVACARAAGNPVLEASALSDVVGRAVFDHPEECARALGEIDSLTSIDRSAAFGALRQVLALRGEYGRLVQMIDEQVLALEHAGLRSVVPVGLVDRAACLVELGRLHEAETDAREGLKWARERESVVNILQCHRVLGAIRAARGDLIGAIEEFGVAIAQLPDWSSYFGAASIRWRTAGCKLALGDVHGARIELDAAAVYPGVPNFDRQFGELWKAALLLAEGNQGGAEDLAHAVLARTGRAGHVMVAAPCLDLLAAIAAERESCLEAARLLGASNAMCERLGLVSWRPPFAQWRVRTIDQLRGVVGEEAFQRAFDEGAALSLEDAVAYARRGRGERKRPSFGWESLTPAESQVVELVTEGLSNAQIATRLFKSERTVATQLSSVFGKLAVSSRTELTAAAAARRRRD